LVVQAGTTFLTGFTELLPEIKDFLKLPKHAEYAQLEDYPVAFGFSIPDRSHWPAQ